MITLGTCGGLADSPENKGKIIRKIKDGEIRMALLKQWRDKAYDEKANKEIIRWGEPRKFDFEVKDHVDIAMGLDILDIERAVRMSRNTDRTS